MRVQSNLGGKSPYLDGQRTPHWQGILAIYGRAAEMDIFSSERHDTIMLSIYGPDVSVSLHVSRVQLEAIHALIGCAISELSLLDQPDMIPADCEPHMASDAQGHCMMCGSECQYRSAHKAK